MPRPTAALTPAQRRGSGRSGSTCTRRCGRTSPVEDSGLLGGELLLGEDPLRFQIAQLLELGDPVVLRVWRWRRRLGVLGLLGVLRLLIRLRTLVGPLVV